MARDRRGRFTAERTTKTTHEVTERITVEELEPPGTRPLNLAPGWDAPVTGRHFYLAQRAGQVERCRDFLAIWAASADPGTPVPSRLIGDATVILRAGPGATPSELTLGRSV